MQNGDEALPSISPAGRGQLVKMLITHESHGIFLKYFAFFKKKRNQVAKRATNAHPIKILNSSQVIINSQENM